MGLGSLLRGGSKNSVSAEAEKDVSEHFTGGEYEECTDCGSCYPSSMKIDDSPLYNSAPKTYAQILVATGQANWVHDISDEPEPFGKVCRELGHASDVLSSLAGGKIRINGTDLDYDDVNESKGQVGVVVLPQFIRIVTDPEHCVEDVKKVLQIKPGGELAKGMIPLRDRGYILLCSHKTRDKRCGITAPILKRALDTELRHADLYRDPDDDSEGGVRVVQCNHVGGHKFAANALIYQNDGMALMLARIRPEHARDVVGKTIQNSVVPPEHVRFCNKLDAYAW